MGKFKVLNILSSLVFLCAWALFLTGHESLAYMTGLTGIWLAFAELNRS